MGGNKHDYIPLPRSSWKKDPEMFRVRQSLAQSYRQMRREQGRSFALALYRAVKRAERATRNVFEHAILHDSNTV